MDEESEFEYEIKEIINENNDNYYKDDEIINPKEEQKEQNISQEQVSKVLENIGIFSAFDYAFIEYTRLLNRKTTANSKDYLHFQFHSFTKHDLAETKIPFPTALFTKAVKKDDKIEYYDLVTLVKSNDFENTKLKSFEDYCDFHRNTFRSIENNETIFYSFKSALLQNDGLFINNNLPDNEQLTLVWISKTTIIVFIFPNDLSKNKIESNKLFSPYISLEIPLYQSQINESFLFELPINL